VKQILNTKQAIKLASALRDSNKTLVLVGGCFDILHIGHLSFLEKAKNKGDILFVLLESDQDIKNKKGLNRPINNQKNRARLLSALKIVDYVVLLSEMKNDQDYDLLLNKIKPDIIAVTTGDKSLTNKTRQAKNINAKLLEVIKLVPHKSSTKIIDVLSQEK